MRTHGSLIKWNDDRGFGFISSAQNNDEIFVHISAFAKDGVRPKIGELISFDIHNDNNGKRRAINVLRAGSHKPNRTATAPRKGGLPIGFCMTVIAALIAIYFSYSGRFAHQSINPTYSSTVTAKPANTKSPQFKCDGRQYCSQMNSRAEAEYFVRNCPDTKMDGDHDGDPCENDSRF